MKQFLFTVALTFMIFSPHLQAEVKLENRQGYRLPYSEFQFIDEQGKGAPLSQYFDQKKPVILAFIYFECPSTCTLLLNGMIQALAPHIYIPGRDFELVVISMNPSDTPALAQKKKNAYIKMYGREDTRDGWHFLTGTEDSIYKLTQKLGFFFEKDPSSGQYNHPSALFFLTSQGTISTVLTGIQFKGTEVRGAIVDAASGRLGTFIERVNSYCITYLPHVGWLDRPSRWLGAILLGALLGIAIFIRLYRF